MAPCAPPDLEWYLNRILWAANRNKPSYYDSPADQDLHKKAKVAARNATMTTLYLGACDAFLLHKYMQPLPILFRMTHWALPSFGSFAAFIVGNALAVKANGGKDTAPCHSVGGFLFASVWANHFKRPMLVFFFGAPLAFAMFNMKKLRDEGHITNFIQPASINPDFCGSNVPYIFQRINWSLYSKFDRRNYEEED